MQIGFSFLIFFAHAFIIYQREKQRATLRRTNKRVANIIRNGDNSCDVLPLLQRQHRLLKEITQLKEVLITHTKTDLVEVLFQTTITFIAFGMSSSSTTTVSGLQGFFAEDYDWLLYLTIILAMKKLTFANVRVQKAGCLGQCERGISCVVYPEGVWYTLTGEENIPELLEHLRSGTIAEHLKMNLEG